MSDKQKVNETASEGKVMTKYDLKMQKRKEEKEKAEREKKIATGVTVLVLVALVCFVLSFPIRTYMTLHNTYITVGGEDLTRVEFDYSYNVVVNNYVNAYAAYLSYFNLDPTQDLSKQTYSGEMSWKDYFEEMAVESIKRNKALKADAAKAGFTYDTTEDFKRFEENQKAAAQAAGVSLKNYVADTYGSYATLDRIKPCVEEALFVAAYYEKINEDNRPQAQEVEAAYQEKPDNYDSVDYYVTQVDAQLGEEPTDEEKEKAMKEAEAKPGEELETFATEENLMENVKTSGVNSIIGSWLFDSARKPGDKEVLEDVNNNRYYCVQFVERYLNQDPTANVRVMIGDSEEEAQEIFEAWKNAGATEESFIQLCEGDYYEKAVDEGGLVEGLARTEDLYAELIDWIFAEDRKPGDCDVINITGVTGFVVYYIGEGKPEWYTTIEASLQSAAVNEYVTALTDACSVEDPGKKLKYLEIRAAQEAAEEASGDDTEGDTAE